MKTFAKVEGINITDADIIKHLGLTQQLEDVLTDIINNYVINQEARQRGIEVPSKELQSYADQLRCMLGLYSAEKTYDYLRLRGLDILDFENFVKHCVEQQIVTADIADTEAIERHFREHKQQYKSIECNHLIVDSQAIADELILILREEGGLFKDFASQHSQDKATANIGGHMGKVKRGTWPDIMEEQIFNGRTGDIMGPFLHEDGSLEIIQLTVCDDAQLDEDMINQVQGEILQQWIVHKKKSIEIQLL